jgi:hypothetical protein
MWPAQKTGFGQPVTRVLHRCIAAVTLFTVADAGCLR